MDIPIGYCQCGCGQKTKIMTASSLKRGLKKGEPTRFLQGHNPKARYFSSKLCAVEGCGRKHCSRGYCKIHYERNIKRASDDWSPDKLTILNETPVEKFFRNIEKTENGCWIWKGPFWYGKHPLKASRGSNYGRLRIKVDGKWKYIQAHRWAYQNFKGDIPPKHLGHHTCRNPACVNPDHVEEVSPQRHQSVHAHKKTRCIRGHEFLNPSVNRKTGDRQCRTCKKELRRKRYLLVEKPKLIQRRQELIV